MIGILTFHRAYNYGAVIQAYALQEECKLLTNENTEVIDYLIPEQRDNTDVISVLNGPKRFMKTLLLLPVITKRILRKKKFDEFVSHKIHLSKIKNISASDIANNIIKYDTVVVGSDQVWNTTKKAEVNEVYFLPINSEKINKIAYAPSIGIAKENDLIPYSKYLKKFDYISCRESGGSKILSNLIGDEVKTVLDPTLLVNKNILWNLTEERMDLPYLLYYSLDGFDCRHRNMEMIKHFGEKFGLQIKLLTPEWPYHKKIGTEIIDAGPEEFLTLIRNASLICTNSFHGTALSIKFGKPFYVLESAKGVDERKRSILNLLDIKGRIISSVSEIDKIEDYDLDYSVIEKKLNSMIDYSTEYLSNALMQQKGVR